MIRVAINGFGRIGRTLTRVLKNHKGIELVAINDLADAKTLSHLLKYDSVHGIYPGEISFDEKHIIIDNKKVVLTNEKSPENLPWEDLGIDVVVESTGLFRTKEKSELHLKAGAKKVIISAPADDKVKSIVIGVNDYLLDNNDLIVSNASCTTNCAAPLIKVINDICQIDSAYITTVHSFTSDQRLHDAPHKDLRRARAATQSIVPTTTGAAKAITKIFPELEGKIGGCGIRVPVPDGSLTDLIVHVKEELTIDFINQKFKEASETYLKGILQYTEDPVVSVDIVGNPHSSIFDADLTSVLGRMIKVVAWYDNEYGYSSRLAELIKKMA